jgi:hypothetical protein
MAQLDGLTEEQKRKYDQLQEQIKKLEAKQKLIAQRASGQRRKDATRRSIVIGTVVFAKAEQNEKIRTAVVEWLRAGVAENMRYLFPEIWPDAKRPSKKRQAQEEAKGETEAGAEPESRYKPMLDGLNNFKAE